MPAPYVNPLNQNQFAITTTVGTLDSGNDNSITVQFYDASAVATIGAGEFVVLSSATAANAPAVSVVAKGADATGAYFGVVLTNPMKAYWAVGEKMEIGVLGAIVMVEAAGAIAAGSKLQYNPTTAQVAVKSGSNSIVGVALENASSAGQLIRAFIQQF